MEDVIWTLDEQYRFTYISPSIQKLRGLSPEEAMQEMIADTLTPASAERVGAIMQQRYEEEQQGIFRPVDRFEIEQYRRDGSTVWGRVHHPPLIRLFRQSVWHYRGVAGYYAAKTDRKRSARERGTFSHGF